MIRTATLLLLTTTALATRAQNWTVGLPVDMLLYTQPFFGGCTPGTDYTFNFPPSAVSGVDHIIRVVNVEPPGATLDLLPGLSGATAGANMVVDAAVMRNLTMAPGTVSALLEFRAVGIPSTEGQSHPCNASPFWISNLMICPEGLIPNVNDGCTVQAGITSIPELMADPVLQWPSPANGQLLRLQNGLQAEVVDLHGRVVAAQARSTGASSLGLGHLAPGVHVLRLISADGTATAQRFLINH